MSATGEATERRASTAARGIVVLLAAAAAAVALWTPEGPDHTSGNIYSSANWGLCVSLAAVGIVLVVLGRRRTATTAASGVGLVVSAQMCGLGVVAFKHWRPHTGIGGTPFHLGLDKELAVVMAAASGVAAIACLWELAARHAVPTQVPRAARWSAMALGVGLLVTLPLLIAQGNPEMLDSTSLGAFVLIYSLPLGGAIALSGWASFPASVGMLVAVLGSAVLDFIGPQMADLVFPEPRGAFVAVAVVAGIALTGRILTAKAELDVRRIGAR